MHQCTGSQVGIKGSEKGLTLLFSICKGKSQQVVSQNCSKASVGIPFHDNEILQELPIGILTGIFYLAFEKKESASYLAKLFQDYCWNSVEKFRQEKSNDF